MEIGSVKSRHHGVGDKWRRGALFAGIAMAVGGVLTLVGCISFMIASYRSTEAMGEEPGRTPAWTVAGLELGFAVMSLGMGVLLFVLIGRVTARAQSVHHQQRHARRSSAGLALAGGLLAMWSFLVYGMHYLTVFNPDGSPAGMPAWGILGLILAVALIVIAGIRAFATWRTSRVH